MSERVLVVVESDEEFEGIQETLTFERTHFGIPTKEDRQNNISKFPSYSFDHVRDGESALSRVSQAVDEENPYCLAVMDINLAKMGDSFFYPREIRRTDTNIQLIITTEQDNPYWEEVAEVMGKRDFLLIQTLPYKPIEMQQNAMVLYDKWMKTKVTEVELSQAHEAYEMMAIEKMRADQSNSAKGDFLASMSHEIRTPLNILLGIHEVMQGTELNEEQKRYVEIANRSGEQLLHLLNTLLNLSKIEAGKETEDRTEFSTGLFFEELFQGFTIKADLNRVNFETQVGEDVPEYVIADKEKLKVILTNLIDNAIKFSKDCDVKVSVSNESRTLKDRVHIKFMIEDTGLGMAEDDLKKIFKNFYQAKSNANQGYRGTGLGLSLTNKYVSILNGEISVISELNQGTTFDVILPMIVAEKPKAPSQKPERVPKTNLSRGLKILLVEDNPDNVELMQIYLKNEKCCLDVAENGKIALEMHENGQYDLILMDIEMPVMDGFEATKTIRRLEKERKERSMPIVALTAFSRSNEIEACMKVGCDDVLRKPLKKARLMAFLQNFIDSGGLA
jgi:signal transduction histidine kinase/ActR/RegA family two-component response regulator